MILTPDLIEKAARALFDVSEGEFKSRFKWEHLRKEQRERALNMARAALEAVLPMIVEECAKVAETQVRSYYNPAILRDKTPWEIAAEIRAQTQGGE